jgi:fluoroacetyl-CoA thioesterase
MELRIGLQHTSTIVVSTLTTAITMGSGDMPVFATPSMIALMENAAMQAVRNALPEGCSTVGYAMDTTHIRPSGIGATITAIAILTEIEGRKLTFHVVAKDGDELIGEGTHKRCIVNKELFMAHVKSNY